MRKRYLLIPLFAVVCVWIWASGPSSSPSEPTPISLPQASLKDSDYATQWNELKNADDRVLNLSGDALGACAQAIESFVTYDVSSLVEARTRIDDLGEEIDLAASLRRNVVERMGSDAMAQPDLQALKSIDDEIFVLVGFSLRSCSTTMSGASELNEDKVYQALDAISVNNDHLETLILRRNAVISEFAPSK